MSILTIKKLDSSRHSVITEHLLQYNHSFNWKHVRILNSLSESNYNKRLISETLDIKEQLNGIKLKKKTRNLKMTYMFIY